MGLEDNPFDWKVTKSGKLIISRGGKQVMIVSLVKAEAIITKLGIDADQDQQILARVTGQYRMGNERVPNLKRR